MKRILFCLSMILMMGQPAAALQSGNLFGLHLMTVHLKPGVSMAQFQDFFLHRVLPEYERQWPEIHAYLLKSFKQKDRFAVVWQFDSVAARNKYFTADGKANALELKAREGVKPVEAELKAKFGDYTVQYTDSDDWVAQ
ncbi:MAG TPA: hypothetical protein VFA87_08900 [Rhizomicrobium sp.]|nr:hypothetical protein [Rhizomicrobium sp.]